MPSRLDAIVMPSTGGTVLLKALALKRKSCFLSTPLRFLAAFENNAYIIIIFLWPQPGYGIDGAAEVSGRIPS